MLGFLNIYKPSGVTSNYVVQKIKKKFHIDRIGHMGTLDPLACGILPIALGKATRLFDYSLNKTKRYTAVFDFGYTTDTLDITGEKTETYGYVPSINEISKACQKLLGEISQIPPRFSAKNVNGVRAYDLARKGLEFELKPKTITIYQLEVLEQLSDFQFKFDIICSSGTYIRSIARDIATLLDTYACMSYLERTETGNFNLVSSVSLNDLLEDNVDINQYIISPIDVFSNFDSVEIDSYTFNDLINGKRPKYRKFVNNTFVLHNNELVGVARKNSDELILDTFLYETKD